MKVSNATKRAVMKHGQSACIKAFQMHRMGEGAATIAQTCPFETIRTTRQADAAINAGREILEQEQCC